MKNVAVLMEDGAFDFFFFVPTRRGIWELKSPSPREIAIQGRKNGYAMVSARRGTGGVLGEAAGA